MTRNVVLWNATTEVIQIDHCLKVPPYYTQMEEDGQPLLGLHFSPVFPELILVPLSSLWWRHSNGWRGISTWLALLVAFNALVCTCVCIYLY